MDPMNLYNRHTQLPSNAGGNNQQYLPPITPQMLGMGYIAGQEMLRKETNKWIPGVNNFWLSLKIYFLVSNSYVLKKITILLYPLSNKVWNRLHADEFERQGEQEVYSRKWASPVQDYNAPDLYIPLMSFMTYVLLYGLGKGIVSSNFTPDVIIQAIWRCLILQLLEAALIQFGVNLMAVSIPFLDIFSYTGYKYLALCINMLSRTLGGTINFLVSLYTASMLSFFVLKSLAAAVPTTTTTGPPRHLLLLGFAAMQFVLILLLSWL